MSEEYVDHHLTTKEIQYIAKACRALPEHEKDEDVIRTLQPKLEKLGRFAKYRELFGDLT